MEIAQITANPLPSASMGSETSVPVTGGATADLFPGRLFASLLAADATSAGQLGEGTEPATGTSEPEAAVRPGASLPAAEMLSCLWKSAAGKQGVTPVESRNTRMTELMKFSSPLFSTVDPQTNVDEVTSFQASSGLIESVDLNLEETGSGVQLMVNLKKEDNTTVEGETDDRSESEEQGFLTAIAVLQDVFRLTVPEANRGIPSPQEMMSAKNAGWGTSSGVADAAALKHQTLSTGGQAAVNAMSEQLNEIPSEVFQGAGVEQASRDLQINKVKILDGGEVDDMLMSEKVTDLTSFQRASLPGKTSVDEQTAKLEGLSFMEVVKAADGGNDILPQRGMTASTATVSSRGTIFAKAHGVSNETDLPASHRVTEEANGLAANRMDSSGLSIETGSPEGAMTGNDSFRQENEGGTASREFLLNHELTGHFETLNTPAAEKTDAVSSQIDKGSLDETIMRQVREKLASSLPEKDNGQVTLRLNPRELGDLTIDIRMENQKVAIDISAQNPVVKEALLQHLDTLKETLTRQNITMERFDVSAGTGHGADQSSHQGRQSAQHRPDEPFSPFEGYYREETAHVRNAEWLPRANALVDMRW